MIYIFIISEPGCRLMCTEIPFENMSQQIIVQKCIYSMNKMYELALSRRLESLYFMIIGIGNRGSINVTL